MIETAIFIAHNDFPRAPYDYMEWQRYGGPDWGPDSIFNAIRSLEDFLGVDGLPPQNAPNRGKKKTTKDKSFNF